MAVRAPTERERASEERVLVAVVVVVVRYLSMPEGLIET